MTEIHNKLFNMSYPFRYLLLSLLLMAFCGERTVVASDYEVRRGERPPIQLEELPVEAYENGVFRIRFCDVFFAENIIAPELNEQGFLSFGLKELDSLNHEYNVVGADQTFASNAFDQKFTGRHEEWGFHLWYDLDVQGDAAIVDMVRAFASTEAVSHAEPHYRKVFWGDTALGGPIVLDDASMARQSNPEELFPDDPDFESQWHYHNTGQTGGLPGADISLPAAWGIETGDPQVIVAVVDGGIQTDHPDIADNMWSGIGYNFALNSSNIIPVNHGTHVAGTVAAVNNNGTGVSGVAGGWGNAPGISLMSAQIFLPPGGAPGGFELAPVYAADNGAAISQNSWGYTSPGVYEEAVLDAIDYFNVNGGGEVLDGGITIFASGNSNSAADFYPGYYSGTLAVAATNHQDAKTWYSNYGSHIDISAPGGETNSNEGEGVLSTLNTGYGYYQGTSMACPHVSGVVGLMLSAAPGMYDADEIKDILLRSTDNIYPQNPGYEGLLGHGRLNAYAALQETIFQMADPDAPAAPEEFELISDPEGQFTVDMQWVNPTASVAGPPLDQIDFLRIYRDGVVIETIHGPVPGETLSFADDMLEERGLYEYAIRAFNHAGQGRPASNAVFVGEDYPASPNEAHLRQAGSFALLSWDAPEEGLNGGYFDGSNLNYTVMRYPDEALVADDIQQTQFYDQLVSEGQTYYYVITAHNHKGTGGSVISNVVLTGSSGLLLDEPFDLDEGLLPLGWSVFGAGYHNWGVHDDNAAGGAAPEMRLNWQPAVEGPTELQTYSVNVERYNQVSFSFKHLLDNYGFSPAQITVHYSLDQGESWTPVVEFFGEGDYGPMDEEVLIDLPAEASYIQFGFRYGGDTNDINKWVIDDVLLEAVGDYYDVRIHVSDNADEPLSGALVTLSGIDGIEILPGEYFINTIKPGEYILEVEKEGFESFSGSLTVIDNHVDVDVVLVEAKYNVFFSVNDEFGEPIQDASVLFGGFMNPAGNYSFYGFTPGQYEYLVMHDMYYDAGGEIMISDSDVNEHVTLIVDDTGLEDHDQPGLIMYPNPVRNRLSIRAKENIQKILIRDLQGQLLLKQSANDTIARLDLSNFRNGVYLVQLHTDTGTQTRFIVVRRN